MNLDFLLCLIFTIWNLTIFYILIKEHKNRPFYINFIFIHLISILLNFIFIKFNLSKYFTFGDLFFALIFFSLIPVYLFPILKSYKVLQYVFKNNQKKINVFVAILLLISTTVSQFLIFFTNY
jgi:hypothetical protein